MAVITAAAITGATITAGTVAAGVATAASLAGTVYASQAQKKGAKKAGEAFRNVGRGIEKVDKVEAGVRQLMGVSKEDENTERDKYNILRDQSVQIVEDQQAGRLSEATRAMLGRNALTTGATGLGRGAVEDAYTSVLGLTMESQAQQGFANYRAMFGQLSAVAQQQQAQNYNMQYNQAAAQASSIMGQAQATASMWQGIGSAVGGIAGGIGSAYGAAGSATNIGAQNIARQGNSAYTQASGMSSGYTGRSVSDRPPGL